MKEEIMMKVMLCDKGGCCPAVEKFEDHVTIGEDDNTVTLSREEWDILVRKIKADEL